MTLRRPPSKRNLIKLAAACVLVALALIIYRFFSFPLVKVRLDKTIRPPEEYVLFAPTVDDLGYAPDKASLIYLMDLSGRIVHTWSVLGSVQQAKMKPDGHLLYSTRDLSFEPRAGLRELDVFGNVVWFYGCRIDHDFVPLPNGNILIHCIADSKAPAVGPGEVRSPRLIEVTPGKQVVWEWRGEEHVTELAQLVGIRFPLSGEGDSVLDWAHSNSCHVIKENASGPSFFSRYTSGVQTLPNGNCFICQSSYPTRNLFLRARRAFFRRVIGESSFIARIKFQL